MCLQPWPLDGIFADGQTDIRLILPHRQSRKEAAP